MGHASFPDRSQNYWQLASIQVASLGFPDVVIGHHVASRLSIGGAVSSIVIGNLLLWIIGLTIISLAEQNKANAIEITKKYLGKFGGGLAALFLILAFLAWYVLQINASISAISELIGLDKGNLRWGAALGASTALFSIGGIVLIRKWCTLVLPILFSFIFYLAFQSFHLVQGYRFWEFSFAGTILVLGFNLPGIVNLPTFFRHSRSSTDSYLGLSLMVILTMLFQLSTFVSGFIGISALREAHSISVFMWLIFILLSAFPANLVNIYFASAGWEMIFPHRKVAKEYAVVGLLGTMAYTFLQLSSPMQYLENMASNFIASLGIILVLAYLMKLVVKHRPRPSEKLINIGCWLFGGIVGTVVYSHGGLFGGFAGAHGMILSMTASLIAYLCVIFVEETIWAIRKLCR